ncbi:MAG TPA: hypothetical protein VII92_08900 [Anaerolineae bacterium]
MTEFHLLLQNDFAVSHAASTDRSPVRLAGNKRPSRRITGDTESDTGSLGNFAWRIEMLLLTSINVLAFAGVRL